ncbi:MAG: hypothetical protein ABSF15_18290 [Candidatus Sulfotelmatobacter sp.]|jgi:hypothetical protein
MPAGAAEFAEARVSILPSLFSHANPLDRVRPHSASSSAAAAAMNSLSDIPCSGKAATPTEKVTFQVK